MGRPARGRRPAGRHDRPHRGRARRRAPHPRPRASRSPAPGPSCATSSPARPYDVSARAVVNAAGVWAGRPGRRRPPAPQPRHPPGAARRRVPRPARRADRCRCPAQRNRFVLRRSPSPTAWSTSGSPTSRSTATPPDVPEPSRGRDRLPARHRRRPRLARPLTRADVVGAYAGLRPLLRGRRAHRRPVPPARRAHLADRRGHRRRRQAHDVPPDGRGRRRRRRRPEPASRPVRAPPRDLPLAGAASRAELARLAATSPSPRLVRRYGADAGLVLADARAVTGLADDELLAPVADGVPVTLAELVFGVTHEGAHDVARPARPAYPGRAGRRATGSPPSPPRSRAIALAAATLR